MQQTLVDKTLSFLEFIYELVELIIRSLAECLPTLRHGLRPVVQVYLRQIYFTGWEALKIILVTSLLIGAAVITQFFSIAGTGSEYLLGKIMVWVVIRELGPLLTAIILIARSGAAIAAELAQMKISGEVEILESLGINPLRYLVMPRILGFTTAIVMLVVYFDVIAILGSVLLTSCGWNVALDRYTEGILAVLSVSGFALSLIKVFLSGLFISAICCRMGLRAEGSMTQIPQAASRAVMQSMFALFVIDGLFSAIFLVL